PHRLSLPSPDADRADGAARRLQAIAGRPGAGGRAAVEVNLDADLPRETSRPAGPDAVLRVGADLLAAAAAARRSRPHHRGRGARPGRDRADPPAVPPRSAAAGAVRPLDRRRA